MSHSNRGLNEHFYKWIDDVRRAMRKEKELQEKLEFYNMKLIGYKGVSYDRIGSSGSRSSGDSELLYWLDKISISEEEIKACNKKKEQLRYLQSMLSKNQAYVLNSIIDNQLIEKIIVGLNLSRSRVYQMIDEIINFWTAQERKNLV